MQRFTLPKIYFNGVAFESVFERELWHPYYKLYKNGRKILKSVDYLFILIDTTKAKTTNILIIVLSEREFIWKVPVCASFVKEIPNIVHVKDPFKISREKKSGHTDTWGLSGFFVVAVADLANEVFVVSPIKWHGSIDQGIQQDPKSPAVHL